MTITEILITGLGVLFISIAFAIAAYHEFEGRRRDRLAINSMIKEIVNVPLYEKRTMWIDGEPHSVRRPLHHAPRHNRGALYEDLSLKRFEKDADNGQ